MAADALVQMTRSLSLSQSHLSVQVPCEMHPPPGEAGRIAQRRAGGDRPGCDAAAGLRDDPPLAASADLWHCSPGPTTAAPTIPPVVCVPGVHRRHSAGATAPSEKRIAQMYSGNDPSCIELSHHQHGVPS